MIIQSRKATKRATGDSVGRNRCPRLTQIAAPFMMLAEQTLNSNTTGQLQLPTSGHETTASRRRYSRRKMPAKTAGASEQGTIQNGITI